jgi:isocitrate dehydrogenase kinase/phosphatase
MTLAQDIARALLDGFDRHYRVFREAGARAKYRFVRGAWAGARESAKARIESYDQRVAEAVAVLRERFPDALADEALWTQIKLAYIGLLHEHLQPECAETFYNSVACRVLARRYYRNEYIFRRPAISTEHLEGEDPTYRCYYPSRAGFRATLREVLTGFGLASPFEDLGRDVRRIVRALREHLPRDLRVYDNFQIQVLSSLFFRNKAAYIVGRATDGSHELPFVVPLLRTARGEVYVDALLLKPENIGRVFSLARSYFLVDMEVPSAYVTFLKTLLPSKPQAELYTLLGLQKQGKTLFYRDLAHHMRHSSDTFVVAPGTRGMVMAVFTCPSFPYVFKVIRDWFESPKDTDRRSVQDKYLLVKYHDRAGRMSDTLEYSNVALPLARFDPALVEELQRVAASSIEIDGDQIVIRHVYIERRMTPLDVYLHDADEAHVRAAIGEYGAAIRELASADIFPGDLLPKNFGVTRYGRVVFYDYDEICRITECNFRRLPTASSSDEETAGEPWFSVGPHDIFPEELPAFLFPPGRSRALFVDMCRDLLDPAFWVATQERIRAGIEDDVSPYPQDLRFSSRFGAT